MAVDDTMNTVVMILSLVSEILSIIAKFRNHFNNKRGSWAFKLIIVVSIAVITCTFVRKNITEVPNVVGKTYSDACNILSNNGLNYSLVLDSGNYVVEQEPVAGTIVQKDTKVKLVTEPSGNNSEVRQSWEQDLDVSYGNIAITFKDTSIILSNEGKTVQCYGNVIKNYVVKEAYLLNTGDGVEYHEYDIEDGVMVFKNIPQDIPFKAIVLLEGYEEAEIDVKISSQNMEGDTYYFTWEIISADADMLLPTTFYMADGDESTFDSVKYLSDVQL